MSEDVTEASKAVQGPEGSAPASIGVKWNTGGLKSSYVNFANASTTQEEVVLNFGVNNNWDRSGGSPDIEIDLLHRVVMSPFAAKRLAELMNKLIAQYEMRYGQLK